MIDLHHKAKCLCDLRAGAIVYGLTYFVEVEWELAGDGAVEPSLDVGGPVLVQDVLATRVLLTNASHSVNRHSNDVRTESRQTDGRGRETT